MAFNLPTSPPISVMSEGSNLHTEDKFSNELEDHFFSGSYDEDYQILPYTKATTNQSQLQQNHLDTLIELWPSVEGYTESNILWGDEIEYCLLKLDHDKQKVKYSRQGPRVIEEMNKEQSGDGVNIEQEAYQYMVETAPMEPFENNLRACAKIESDMSHRRKAIQEHLGASTTVFTLSRFGMFGATKSEFKDTLVTSKQLQREAQSLSSGPRYKAIMDLVEERRGCRIQKQIPLYDTPPLSPSSSTTSLSSTNSSNGFGVSPDAIAVDDLIYSLGGCAIQVNMGMTDMSQALRLHDQFCPIGPLMLALTAASPILRGFLVASDTRWDSCASALDDRTSDESSLNPRWGVSPMYFENRVEVQSLNCELHSSNENDVIFARQLQQAGFPQPMARYFAKAINRAQYNFPKASQKSDQQIEDDFEKRLADLKSHLSTLWPHIRLKFPVPKQNMPWIIEVRSMEVQPTDFENAAIAVFINLLRETVLHFNLEFRVPIKMVEENMARAQACSAVETQKFWFNVSNDLSGPKRDGPVEGELTLNEIFNGYDSVKGEYQTTFPGLLHYVRRFVAEQAEKDGLSQSNLGTIRSYLDFMSQRASGVDPTPAKWTRDFMLKHEEYRGDSRVTQKMYYDMVCKVGEKSKI